jgi:hypothetical protein
LDGTDRLIQGPVPVFPGSSAVQFLGLNEQIPAGSVWLWIVTADVSRETPVGSTFGVNLSDDAGVTAVGACSTATLPVEGAPILGAELTVVEAPPAPEPADRAGLCGGSAAGPTSPAGLLGLLLLAAAFLAPRWLRHRICGNGKWGIGNRR